MMIWQNIATGILRGVLNNAMMGTTETQLRDAIRDGTSLWGTAEGDIRRYSSEIPPYVLEKGNEVVKKIETDYGGFTNLVMRWLERDQITYYEIINTTFGGYEWLDKQVYDILRGIGMLK